MLTSKRATQRSADYREFTHGKHTLPLDVGKLVDPRMDFYQSLRLHADPNFAVD